jgi:sugar lactone lactonase YvrE
MRRLTLTLLSLLVAAPAAAQVKPAEAPVDSSVLADPAPVSPRVLRAYRDGIEARRGGNFPLSRERLGRALALAPGHPMLLLNLARAWALEGDTLQAGALLGRVVATGVRLDLPNETELASLRGTAAWAAAQAEMARRLAPEGVAEVAARLTEPDFMPEGIAADPVSGDLFVGSMHERKIARIARDGTVTDFVPAGRDGLWAVIGLKVDADRRLLWACSGATEQMSGWTRADTSRTGLFGFDLDSGRLVTRAILADTTRAHLFNDCCVSSDGDVYATDTSQGGVYRLRHDGARLETVVGPDTLAGSNGIALSGDGRRLYVAEYGLGIAVVDLATGALTQLAHPEEIATCYVDGLLWHQNSLVVVQNGRGLDRVARLYLDEPGLRVIGMTVLAGRLPEFDEPTTATIADGACLVLAATQLNRFGAGGALRPADPSRPFLVMRTPLQ